MIAMTLGGIWLALAAAGSTARAESEPVVGMWHSVFRLGDSDGPVYDETLEQFHADGTEFLISAGLPPALGNVCAGVWEQTAPRAYKLRHMTWNWTPDDSGFGVPGTFAGLFEIIVNVFVDRRGNRFTGTWAAKSFDPDGNHIPELDAQGVVRATRITVDGAAPFATTASELSYRSAGFVRGCG
jgi:hypothetical protein